MSEAVPVRDAVELTVDDCVCEAEPVEEADCETLGVIDCVCDAVPVAEAVLVGESEGVLLELDVRLCV